jgi:DNA-binding transcriptional ArsR family regulator
LANALVNANVSRVIDLLSAAAEPNRRRLLQLLVSGPRTVSELAEHFAVTRSAISQHLGVLAGVGLVSARKSGRQRIYTIDGPGMARLRAEMDRFWITELDVLVFEATDLAAKCEAETSSGSPMARRPATHKSHPH